MSDRVDIAFGLTLSRATVLTLAAAHIGMYAQRLELKGPGVRVDECQGLLGVWRSVRLSASRGEPLGFYERNEVFDAVTSGDYDTLLTPDEFAIVHRLGRAS